MSGAVLEAPVTTQREDARQLQSDDAPAHMQVHTLLNALHAELLGQKGRLLQS